MKAGHQRAALCKWGTTLLVEVSASIGFSSSVTNNVEQEDKH